MEYIILLIIILVGLNLISSYALDSEIKTISVDKCKPHKWEYNKDGNMQCKICKLNTKDSLGK